jgi:hypothetical protein
VLAYYDEVAPIPPESKPGTGIHHVGFGRYLKARMDALKIECHVRITDKGDKRGREKAEFFGRIFGPAGTWRR